MLTKITTEIKGAAAQSFLSFKLGKEDFAIEVKKIMEILEVSKITKVPHAPNFLKGVINLRGGVLPLIDAKIKFGMEPIVFNVDTCILVLNINVNDENIMIGALVDSVSEVFEIEASKIQASPSIGSRYRADFIQGMIREDDRFMMLLDIDKVFTNADMESIMETNAIAS